MATSYLPWDRKYDAFPRVHVPRESGSLDLQVFVRAFDLDERLVGVAFMDVGVYVTALRCLKNLLLISDAVKSVWFVAFQVSRGYSFWKPGRLLDWIDMVLRKTHSSS